MSSLHAIEHKDFDDLRTEVTKLSVWKKGNGAKGAEERLQEVEEVTSTFATKKDMKDMEERIVNRILVRKNSFKDWVKLLSPYFATIATFVIAYIKLTSGI